VLFWLAKHVIIFLLIPGDPSLALRDDRTFGVKEGKEKPELAQVRRNEVSPSHSRNLIKKMCIKGSPSKGGETLLCRFSCIPKA
jgi:hypothetical protein